MLLHQRSHQTEAPPASDVRAWAWPEAHGLGLAYKGLGLLISLARPSIKAWAWSGLVWAQAQAYYQF